MAYRTLGGSRSIRSQSTRVSNLSICLDKAFPIPPQSLGRSCSTSNVISIGIFFGEGSLYIFPPLTHPGIRYRVLPSRPQLDEHTSSTSDYFHVSSKRPYSGNPAPAPCFSRLPTMHIKGNMTIFSALYKVDAAFMKDESKGLV